MNTLFIWFNILLNIFTQLVLQSWATSVNTQKQRNNKKNLKNAVIKREKKKSSLTQKRYWQNKIWMIDQFNCECVTLIQQHLRNTDTVSLLCTSMFHKGTVVLFLI
jgi:hypothetical protein